MLEKEVNKFRLYDRVCQSSTYLLNQYKNENKGILYVESFYPDTAVDRLFVNFCSLYFVITHNPVFIKMTNWQKFKYRKFLKKFPCVRPVKTMDNIPAINTMEFMSTLVVNENIKWPILKEIYDEYYKERTKK